MLFAATAVLPLAGAVLTLLFFPVQAQGVSVPGYVVTPDGLPSGVHVSRLIGGVHDARASFPESGQPASAGVESMAEEGVWRGPRDGVYTQTTAAPEITSTGPFTVAEGSTGVATLTATDTDTNANDLTWSKTGGADSAAFTLNQDGVLAFASAKDYETPDDADGDGSYEVSVLVSDGVDSDTADLVVTLGNEIELHTTIDGPTAVSFAENGATRVATFTASSDDDRDGVEWIISGGDAQHFTIDTPSGALRFHIDPVSPNIFPKLPDFEDPDDSGVDNSYSISLQASAGSATTSSLAVTVTVGDVDEAGAISLSTARPGMGSELTATLTDPDEVTAGTVTWQWERSSGPNAWTVISSAISDSYEPVAADTNAFLRVTATYDDEHDSGHKIEKSTANVVTGPLLNSLQVSTDSATGDATHAMKPAFVAQRLHYAVGCNGNDTMRVTLSAPASARVAVDGIQVSGNNATVDVTVTKTSDVSISVTDARGAHTVYWVHCLEDVFYQFETVRQPGVEGTFDGLLMLLHGGYLVMLDNDGVPRHRRSHSDAVSRAWFFRVDPGGLYRYAFPTRTLSGMRHVVLDQHLQTVAERVGTALPLSNTDHHAFAILPNSNYLLIAYEGPVRRDLSHLTFPDQDGNPYGASEELIDSAIQITSSAGRALFTWNSWGQMPLEDCVQHRFARTQPIPGYAHLNSVQQVGNQIVGSFRGCSKVLAIDATTGAVAWRVGRTNLSDAEWEARDIGPAPIRPVNDPEGEFCGQHSATILPNGHLLLYDNGAACLIDPWTRLSVRTDGVYSRALEYALDHDAGEAVFVRDHSLHGDREAFGYSSGQVVLLDNGDWLVSWGRNLSGDPVLEETVTQVDPATGREKFAIRFTAANPEARPYLIAAPVPADALAPRSGSLKVSLPPSEHTSVFHSGAGDSPQVVVAFSRPVVDFNGTSRSLAVLGATVASVSPHSVGGDPANSYLVTLTPNGDGAIVFRLVIGETCAEGGICTADGTALTGTPAVLVIGPPVSVTFGQATYSVSEGNTLSVDVRLSAAHRGVRGVSVPVVLTTGVSASAGDVTAGDSVTFAADEMHKTLSFEAADDDFVEGPETAALEFGALPDGVTAGATSTSTVTVTDADEAAIDFTLTPEQVDEGSEARLTFAIANGVTFERDQTIDLTFGGAATPGDDFTILDGGGNTLSAPYALVFRAGATSVDATLRAADDAEIERTDETVIVSARLALTDASLGTRTVTIPPSDVPETPVVTITPESAVSEPQVTEGQDATFRLTRSGPVTAELTVGVLVEETGAMLLGTPPASATFAAGASQTTLPVATDDDDEVEDPSTVTVTIRPSTGYETEAGAASAEVVVVDDVARLELRVGPAEVTEGGGGTVAVEITNGVTFPAAQTIALALSGSAGADDFAFVDTGGRTLSAPYTLTIPAGERAGAVHFTTVNDADREPSETIIIAASRDGAVFATETMTIRASPLRLELASLSVVSAGRAMYPAFNPGTLHYAVGCVDAVFVTMRLSTKDASTRLAVNGIRRASKNATVELWGLDGDDDIQIVLSNGDGARTTYVVHCMNAGDPVIRVSKQAGSSAELLTASVNLNGTGHVLVIDTNGVPRVHRRIISPRINHFRTQANQQHPYSYAVILPRPFHSPGARGGTSGSPFSTRTSTRWRGSPRRLRSSTPINTTF